MAMKRRSNGKFAKGNKSGTQKKSSGKRKGLPAFLKKKLGRKR